MINAFGTDILPGVRGDLDEPLVSAPAAELAAVLLSVVDRGWIEVCPVTPWTAPDGRHGCRHGTPLAGEELTVLLADADNWEYPTAAIGSAVRRSPSPRGDVGSPGEPRAVTAPACPTESHTH
ncbi:hypothetical protein OH809_36610 [Streptomyces sp. NBC_00873]|uniref:hypothetical protein n=1 Tax=unclassified Streptomyces TaxID=2593676 RepID=UPI00386FBE9D|nr:hypothetical protein OH809_36610 [Streptomyces sp. NBC_00873]WTA42404.1 hypothetical protein OH821_07100 [Streptomyces sp. NBC_00842]